MGHEMKEGLFGVVLAFALLACGMPKYGSRSAEPTLRTDDWTGQVTVELSNVAVVPQNQAMRTFVMRKWRVFVGPGGEPVVAAFATAHSAFGVGKIWFDCLALGNSPILARVSNTAIEPTHHLYEWERLSYWREDVILFFSADQMDRIVSAPRVDFRICGVEFGVYSEQMQRVRQMWEMRDNAREGDTE